MLSGTVPSSLSFPNAQTITLGYNKLTGHVPWSSLLNSSGIEILAVNDNDLDGSLPQMLPGSLQHFVVHANRFQGPMPSFAQTPRLKTLSVHRNALVGSVTLPALQEWKASCSDVSDSEWMRRFGAEPTIAGQRRQAAHSCKEVPHGVTCLACNLG